MTPDIAALRAMADAADDVTSAGMFVRLDPDTVRALCDAADEVERLTSKYEEWESMHSACIALREDVARHEREAVVLNESIGRHRRDLDAAGGSLRRVAAERDAAFAAHAALFADLRVARQWLDVATDSLTDSGDGTYVAVSESLAQVRAMLDRHAGAGS